MHQMTCSCVPQRFLAADGRPDKCRCKLIKHTYGSDTYSNVLPSSKANADCRGQRSKQNTVQKGSQTSWGKNRMQTDPGRKQQTKHRPQKLSKTGTGRTNLITSHVSQLLHAGSARLGLLKFLSQLAQLELVLRASRMQVGDIPAG